MRQSQGSLPEMLSALFITKIALVLWASEAVLWVNSLVYNTSSQCNALTVSYIQFHPVSEARASWHTLVILALESWDRRIAVSSRPSWASV